MLARCSKCDFRNLGEIHHRNRYPIFFHRKFFSSKKIKHILVEKKSWLKNIFWGRFFCWKKLVDIFFGEIIFRPKKNGTFFVFFRLFFVVDFFYTLAATCTRFHQLAHKTQTVCRQNTEREKHFLRTMPLPQMARSAVAMWAASPPYGWDRSGQVWVPRRSRENWRYIWGWNPVFLDRFIKMPECWEPICINKTQVDVSRHTSEKETPSTHGWVKQKLSSNTARCGGRRVAADTTKPTWHLWQIDL